MHSTILINFFFVMSNKRSRLELEINELPTVEDSRQKDQYDQGCQTCGAYRYVIAVNKLDFQFEFVLDLRRHQDHNAEKPEELIRHAVAIEELSPLRNYFTQDRETRADAVRSKEYPAQ